MTADSPASFRVRHSTGANPIHWLILGGAFLIAAITIGTTIMAGNFRERALNSSKRELENTVLLLARHFDKQLEDFTVIQRLVVAQIEVVGITSPDIFRGEMATLEWHEVLRVRSEGYSDVAGVNLFDSEGVLINSFRHLAGSGRQNRRSGLLQGLQIRSCGDAGFGRTGAEPLHQRLGDRHRSQGDWTERRISGGRHTSDFASQHRKALRIPCAW